jgi:hypothetical protein
METIIRIFLIRFVFSFLWGERKNKKAGRGMRRSKGSESKLIQSKSYLIEHPIKEDFSNGISSSVQSERVNFRSLLNTQHCAVNIIVVNFVCSFARCKTAKEGENFSLYEFSSPSSCHHHRHFFS